MKSDNPYEVPKSNLKELESEFKFGGSIKWVCVLVLVIAFVWEVIITHDDFLTDLLWYVLTFFISPYFLTKIWNISIADFFGVKKVNYFWSLSIVCALWVAS